MIFFGECCYSNQYDEISDDEFSDDEISASRLFLHLYVDLLPKLWYFQPNMTLELVHGRKYEACFSTGQTGQLLTAKISKAKPGSNKT